MTAANIDLLLRGGGVQFYSGTSIFYMSVLPGPGNVFIREHFSWSRQDALITFVIIN